VTHVTLPAALAVLAGMVLWIVVVLSAVYMDVQYWAYLKTNHPDVWRGLGKPEIPGFRRGRFNSFTLLRRYRRVNDLRLTRLGDISNALSMLAVLVFFGLAFLACSQGLL
jgi:hypothetical protein